ncbi:hypothetical protein FQZ97_1206750 [compost metagenome]
MTSGVFVPVRLVKCFVFHGNVGGIAHYNVIALPEDPFELCRILNFVNVLLFIIQQTSLDTLPLPLKSTAMQQGIATRQLELKLRGFLDLCAT